MKFPSFVLFPPRPYMERPPAEKLIKWQWIERCGGQALLDENNLEVVPCEPSTCTDVICHGWKVVTKK